MTIPSRLILTLAGSSLLVVSSANAQSIYTWANSNVTNTPATLDWFTGGPNSQGAWTGGTPVSSNLNTIRFFSAPPTAVPNTTTVTQGSNLNNGGTAFQLATLTLSGQPGSASSGTASSSSASPVTEAESTTEAVTPATSSPAPTPPTTEPRGIAAWLVVVLALIVLALIAFVAVALIHLRG